AWRLGRDGRALGPLGGALAYGRAAAGPAPGARRRPRPEKQLAHRRAGDPHAAGARAGRARAGGRLTARRRPLAGAGRAVLLLAAAPLAPLASLSPQDSLYPGALFTAGRIAPDAATAATDLQRVVIEYGQSVWADSALALLTQLHFAQGDPAATVQAAERLRRDYPDSPLRPRAAFWGARAYFELKDELHGCALIREALEGAGGDVEFRNQVGFYAERCT